MRGLMYAPAGVALLSLLAGGLAPAGAKLVHPRTPPRGVNSFDIQYDRRANSSVPVWNETEFRALARAMAAQLLPAGYDTIVIDGGWAGSTVDTHGRPTPDVSKWPSAGGGAGFKPLADWTHALGLKFGVWTLRGVLPAAVAAKLPVLGASPPATLDEVAYVCHGNNDRWCNCTWDKQGAGLDPAHPAAQAFYHSLVELYASWGVDLIKWDCMYDDGAATATYAAEAVLALRAVEAVERPMVLSWSPGGGMTLDSAAWMAGYPGGNAPPGESGATQGVRGSMYRITGDFHSRRNGLWIDGLGEHLFTVGNLSRSGLIGANHTYPDMDILDLGPDSVFFGKPAAQLHASMWMMARSPLMFGGQLPIEDPTTLDLVTNKLALLINTASSPDLQVAYEGDCSCTLKGKTHGHACKPLNEPGAAPCVATWWSTLGRCKAVAVLNVGAAEAAGVAVKLAKLGLSGPHTVTEVYKAAVAVDRGRLPAGFTVTVPALGGGLLVVAPKGVEPAACVQ